MDSARRIPELDGLRGIAIGLVLAHHYALGVPAATAVDRAVLSAASAGWIGVDLFFVLSGYLITGRLLEARASGAPLAAFYARRALRIAPPYFLLLATCLVVGPALGVRLAPRSESDLAWFALFASNILTVVHGWPDRVVAHLWSLAVEEHFYLLWPLLALWLPGRRLAAATIAIALASASARAWGLAHGLDGSDVYVLTFTRLDGLALGATLAALEASGLRPERWRGVASALVLASGLGLAVLVWFGRGHWGSWDRGLLVAGLFALGLAGASGLAAVLGLTPGHVVRRALRLRPLLLAGRLSYGMYLFHMPLVEAAHRAGWQPAALVPPGTAAWPYLGAYAAVQAAALIAVSDLSWRLVEAPALRLKRFLPGS
jgi:peptidoglycan/LPS O-acetylase OafA/YrhL